MTEPDEPKYKWITLHGQRVRVTICPPGEANARRLLSELRSDPKAARYEQREASETLHHGGHSHPYGYEAADETELKGQIRQTRGSWASGWDVTSKGGRTR